MHGGLGLNACVTVSICRCTCRMCARCAPQLGKECAEGQGVQFLKNTLIFAWSVLRFASEQLLGSEPYTRPVNQQNTKHWRMF